MPTGYAPGWRNIKADGALRCGILVRDGAVIPHVAPAQSTDRIDWDNIEWKHYGTPGVKKGKIFKPGMTEISVVDL